MANLAGIDRFAQANAVGVAETGELSNARSALLGVAETGEKILLNDFWYFSSLKSTIKKSYFMIFSGRRGIKQCTKCVAWRRRDRGSADPYKIKLKYSQHPKQKSKSLPAFSFAIAAAKEKAIKKKSAETKISRSAERLLCLGDADTHASHMCQFPSPPSARASLPKGLT